MKWSGFSRFMPDLLVEDVTHIPLDRLEAAGIRGLLFDLDNTLLPHYSDAVDPSVARWLARARERGFALCVVTNGPAKRALPLCKTLDVPCVHRARKPLRRGLRKALGLLNLRPEEAAMIGDQLFTDIWAGRRLGMRTIWVRPPALKEPLTVSFKRPVEGLFSRLFGLPEVVMLPREPGGKGELRGSRRTRGTKRN